MLNDDTGLGANITPVPDSGPIWYVDQANGNDGNSGDAASPWQTLAKAAATVQPGDTVIVKAGTYNGGFTPTVSGNSSALIVFKSETPGGAAINGQVNLSGVDYVRIDGFSISNTASEGVGVLIQDFYDTAHGHGIQVANCYIHDGGGHAISAANVTDLLVESNEMYNNYHDGVIFSGSGRNNQNVTIRGNYIHHNGQDGIHPEGSNILIENNRIDDQYTSNQHSDGLEIYGPIDGLVIRNNTISDTTQNIYISAENYAGSYIRNVEVLGNVLFSKNNSALGKGFFVVGNQADVTNVRIEGNTIAYVAMNSVTDAYASNASCYVTGVTIRNNIFYMCDVALGVHSPATVDYNIHYYPKYFNLVSSNGTNYTDLKALTGATGMEEHGLAVDPLFVNAAGRDFHLTSGSPAASAGTSIDGLTVDPDGHQREANGLYPIGAYQVPQ